MAELVVLQNKREKLTDGQDRLVSQLEDLLRKARGGKIRGMVFGTVGSNEESTPIALGITNTDDCGIHELVGVSQILNDRILQLIRDAKD